MFLALLSILALVPELSSFLRYPAISTPFSYRIQTQLQDENTAGDYTDKNIEGYIDTATHLSDEEYAEVLTLAGLGDEQKEKEDLNLKVKDAMEKEWDLRKGVNTALEGSKPKPIKANIDLLSHAARKELGKSNYTGAIDLYQQCIDYNPRDGRPWLGLARVYWKKRDTNKAEKCYKDGLYYNPKNPYLLQGMAVMLEKLGREQEANKILIESVKSNPRHAASWCALGAMNNRRGEVGTARYCYTSAVEGDARSYVALQALGLLEEQEGNTDQARELYSRAIEKSNGRSVHSYHAWALLERKQGDVVKAYDLLDKAFQCMPDSTRIRLSLAELCELKGETEEVRKLFRDGERSAYKFGDAGFFQAYAMFELRELQHLGYMSGRKKSVEGRKLLEGGDDQEELEAISELFEDWVPASVPVSVPATTFVPYSIEDLEEETEVVAADTKTVTSTDIGDSKRGAGRRYNSDLYSDDGEYYEQVAFIRRLFKTGVTINKYHSASWVAWAKFEQKSGNLDIARKLLIAGISNFPNSRNIAWFHACLGHLSRQQGDIGTSRACYQRAVDTSAPQKSLPVLLEFARMETFHGSLKEASRILDLANKRFPENKRVAMAFCDLDKGKERMEY